MAKTIVDNQSNKHLVVDSLTVIHKIKGGGIKQISDNIEALRQGQETLSEQTKNYWESLARDNVINPEEKKVLYKEWQFIVVEYPALVTDASSSGLPDSAQELIDYKNNYEALYDYLFATLKIFDNMTAQTKLNNRELFIQRYNDYYTSRDTLRSAIKNGQLSDMHTEINGELDHINEELIHITQGGVADGSITVDKLASDVKEDIRKFEDAAATGFLTDDIINRIDSSVTASSDELNLKIEKNKSDSKLYLQFFSDRVNSLIDNANRATRTMISQTNDAITLSVINLEDETATQFRQTAESITAMATDLRRETSAAVKVTSDRIAEMVKAGSSDAYLSLSVGVPYYLSLSKYEAWETLLAQDQSGLDLLHDMYNKVNIGTDEEPSYYYVMKDTTTTTQVKSLTNKMRALDALSSQIVIDADMIQVGGETVFSNTNKIKDEYYDYNAVTSMGFTNAMFDGNPIFDGTVISGGTIKTGLINADGIIAYLVMT